MPSTAWKPAGTGATHGTGVAWTDPGNISAQDFNYAWAALTAKNTTSRFLRARNFGFTTTDVPSGATIVGVEFRFERRASNSVNITDGTLKIAHNSAGTSADQVGSNKASATAWNQTTMRVDTYGGAADLWGTTLTDAQVRSADFGVDLSGITASNTNAEVELVECRITYSVVTGFKRSFAGLVQ